MTSMQQKTVLVTGACGLLGASIVKALVNSGHAILAVDINSQALDQLVQTYGQHMISPFVTDLGNEAGIISLHQHLENINLPIFAAVHAAYPRSLGWGARLEDLQAHHLFSDLSTQLGGAILFSKVILQYFKQIGEGTLIHLSSIQGVAAPKFEHYEGTPMHSPVEYAAIKAGIISITRWLSKYYANHGIRVNCVSPGGIYDHQPDIFVKRYRSDCMNIGMLSPEHVSAAVLFLLSPAAIAINGHNLIVDDGWSL